MPKRPPSAPADPRRSLPSVESLLGSAEGIRLGDRFGRAPLLEALRGELDRLRQEQVGSRPEEILSRIGALLAEAARPVLPRVLNGTGVLLHTNLGRSPLGAEALEAAASSLTGYAALEWDPASGRRSVRGASCRRRIAELYGAEEALVVGNNAAAILLVLRAFAKGRGEVLVSRGELVAIGGGFRIPEILSIAGCRLVEVGTTNRTQLSDFRQAATSRTRLVLRATPSNFDQRGFVESPDPAGLAALARELGVPLVVDQGSGAPFPLDRFGLAGVSTVSDSLRAGADLVAASGDKLLGGPQAGILVGRADLVRKVAADPLFRAVRPGRFTFALLGEVVRSHLAGTSDREVPLYRMLAASTGELETRAERILRALGPRGDRIRCLESRAVVGGGTTPDRTVPSRALAITPARKGGDAALAARLRRGEPPLATRSAEGRILVDLRTILPEEDPALVRRLDSALR